MKQKFQGWNTVFGFTFRQASNNMRYKMVTFIISLIIIGACIAINLITTKSDIESEEAKPSPIHKVFILDESGFDLTSIEDYNPVLSSDLYSSIEYELVINQTRAQVLETAGNDGTASIAGIIMKEDTGYSLELAIPHDSTITVSDAWTFMEPLQLAFESCKLSQSELTQEQLTYILTPTISSYSEVGEESNITVMLIKTFAPMLFGLILYMMFLLYGQNVSKSVSIEKTSKLMDTLLTSIHPYGLITGKVLAITCSGIIQFSIWVASILLGLFASNAITQKVYPNAPNILNMIIQFLRDNIGESALSLPSCILALIVFCIGFLFFCTLAGVAGSLVAKPEDVATTQALFTFPIVISFFVCYFGSLNNNEGLMTVVRYIPFTIPFSVPIDLLTGVMGFGQGIASLLILSLFTLLFIMFSAKLYKGMVLYTGQKVSLKLALNIMRAKQ